MGAERAGVRHLSVVRREKSTLDYELALPGKTALALFQGGPVSFPFGEGKLELTYTAPDAAEVTCLWKNEKYSVGAIVNGSGTVLFGTQGMTATNTGAGSYHITIPAGILSQAAIPVFMPVTTDATTSAISTDLQTFVDEVFSKDTAFTLLMTEIKQ